MKYALLILLMLFAPDMGSASEALNDLSEIFLQQINSASSYTQIIDALETHSEDIGVDLSQYNSLTLADKASVLQKIKGNGYSNISDFDNAFNSAIANTVGLKSNSGGGSVVVPIESYIYISGVVSLPDDEFAPQGGYEITLLIGDAVYDSIIIPQGSNSVEYSIEHQPGLLGTTTALRVILSGDEGAKYQTHTYTEPFSLSKENKALTVNVEIPYAQRKIGGVLRLADDVEVLNEDLPIRIEVSKSDFIYINRDCEFYINKILKAGQREVEFSIGVDDAEYRLVYYADTYGKPSLQHVLYKSESIFIDVSEGDETDTVIPIDSQSYIYGYVRLPDGETAPDGGLLVKVGSVTVEIPHGESQAEYRTGLHGKLRLYCSVVTENYSGTRFSGGYYNENNVLSLTRYFAERFYNLTENLNRDLTLRKTQWIEGTISLNEPLNSFARVVVSIEGELNYYTDYNIYMQEGTTSIPYFIEIDEIVDLSYNIRWTLEPYSDEYLNVSGSAEFTAEETFNHYNIDVQVVRPAVLFSGSISLPESMVASEDAEVFLLFASENHYFHKRLIINAGENSTNYVIYSDSTDMSGFSDEYTLSVNIPSLTGETLYYNGDGFSFEPSFTVAMENETIVQDLVLPTPNSEIRGNITLPTPATSEIRLLINISSNGRGGISKSITLSEGAQSFDYEIKLLIPNEQSDYKISYMVVGSDDVTYYNDLELYISEDGYTLFEYAGKIFDLYGQSQTLEQDIDLSGLVINECIKGEFILPTSYIVPNGEYFSYTMHATNGRHTQSNTFTINEEANRGAYVLSLPKAYQSGEWTVWYSVGNVVDEPSAPVVPKPPDTPPAGGGSVGGGGYYPKPVIPEVLRQGYNIYLTQDGGLSFFDNEAQKFTFNQGQSNNIDIYALDMTTSAPRIIGGFFTSATKIPKGGINVSVILQNAETDGEIIQNFVYIGAPAKYKFVTYGEGEYILKYIIDGETFYYQNEYKLTTDMNLAAIIKTEGITAQYKKDVYYKNIYPASYYASLLQVRRGAIPIIHNNVKIQVYNEKGNLFDENYLRNYIGVAELPIVIGYEVGGYKAYFTEYSTYRLAGHTTDFNMAARIYPISQSYPYAQMDADISVIGFAKGIGTEAEIETSYFDYDENDDNTIFLRQFTIFARNAEEVENENMFIACYEQSGKLKFVKNFPLVVGESIIDLGLTIDKSDVVKVIGLGNGMNPLFEELYFFGL